MKKTILIAAIILAGFVLKAQQTAHTLSFSRAMVLVNGTTYTVPTAASNNGINCVWKVVSATFSTQSATTINTITLNGVANHITPYTQPTTYTLPNAIFPMWLPAGTTVLANNNIASLYVIEFIVN